MQTVKKPIRIGKGILGSQVNFEDRLFSDLESLKKLVQHCRGLGLQIVLTQGTWDMVHVGHARYLEIAKGHGDFLIVGVDSDEKVRSRKGPDRPVVPEEERLEILSHLRSVDAVFLKQLNHPRWSLIKIIQPDVLIATSETYDKDDLRDLKKYCKSVVVLDPTATTSTSAKLRRLQIGMASKFEETLTPKLVQAIKEALEEIKGLGGKKNPASVGAKTSGGAKKKK